MRRKRCFELPKLLREILTGGVHSRLSVLRHLRLRERLLRRGNFFRCRGLNRFSQRLQLFTRERVLQPLFMTACPGHILTRLLRFLRDLRLLLRRLSELRIWRRRRKHRLGLFRLLSHRRDLPRSLRRLLCRLDRFASLLRSLFVFRLQIAVCWLADCFAVSCACVAAAAADSAFCAASPAFATSCRVACSAWFGCAICWAACIACCAAWIPSCA